MRLLKDDNKGAIKNFRKVFLIRNYHKVENNQNIYRTAIQVGSEIYTYKNIDAYHYVKEFMIGKDSVKLIEIFWPEHYIKTLSMDDIYNNHKIKL